MYNPEKYKEKYRGKPKEHLVYLILIDGKEVLKVGRTCRLSYRLHNLKQALYETFTYKIIPCTSSQESLALEKHIKACLKPHHITGEWFSATLQAVAPHLTGPFEKYAPHLQPQVLSSSTMEPSPSPAFNINFQT